MQGLLRRLRWCGEYTVFAGTMLILRNLPYRAALWVGRCLGRLAFSCLGRRRSITQTNLGRILGDSIPSQKHRQIAIGSFENLGMLLVDFSRFPRLRKNSLDEFVEVQGLDNLEEAAGSGRGVLCLGAHFGSFELMSFSLALHGHPLSFIVRPLDNPYLDRLVKRYREASGNRTIPKKEAVREMVASLKRGGIVGILIDQHAAPESGVFVDLMGTKTWTSSTLATIAIRSRIPVIPVVIERKEDCSGHVLTIEPPVTLLETGDKRKDVEENTLVFNRILGRWVNKRPELWLWCHRRWR
ncbi:lysophospholipid acyltransferase family protein [Acidobacteriota bacterium]